MSILSKATGIHISGHGVHVNGGELKSGLSNLAKNVSPLLAFTPLGVAGAGLLAAGGELGRGKNIGQAVKAGISNAAIGSGLRAGVGAVRGAMNHVPSVMGEASSTSGGLASTSAAPGTSEIVGGAGAWGSPADAVTHVASQGALNGPAVGLGDKAWNVAKGVGNFVEHHPNAVGMGLTAAGNLATAGSANRQSDAETRRINLLNDESEYDLQRKRASDLALDPVRNALWGGLGTAISRNNASVAPNPYANPYLPATGGR